MWTANGGCALPLPSPEAKPGLIPAGYFDFGQTGGGNNRGLSPCCMSNRHPYQGVDSNHKEVLFADLAGQTVELTFLLWSGLQGGDPSINLIHRASAAKLGYLHEETDGLLLFRQGTGQDPQASARGPSPARGPGFCHGPLPAPAQLGQRQVLWNFGRCCPFSGKTTLPLWASIAT